MRDDVERWQAPQAQQLIRSDGVTSRQQGCDLTRDGHQNCWVTSARHRPKAERSAAANGLVRYECDRVTGIGAYRAARFYACYAFRMCIICVEFEKGRMTAKEARRALGEMVPKVGAEHSEEVERVLRRAEEKGAATPPKP